MEMKSDEIHLYIGVRKIDACMNLNNSGFRNKAIILKKLCISCAIRGYIKQ